MDADWAKKLLHTSQRASEKEQEEFLALVDQACGVCTLEIARMLMKTFSDTPDYGTQERVVRTLATADDQIVTQAILEELPRLVKEAPEWAEALVGLEVDRRPELLQRVASTMPESVRKALRELLADKDLQDFYPGACSITV
jgi:hypothetical protein